MTSNMGSDIIRENFEKINERNAEDIIENTRNQVFNLLKATIRPEFLNRIDETIMFRPLSQKDLDGIIRIQLSNLLSVLAKQEITFHITDDCLNYLRKEGFDPQFGARPLKRLIQRKILDELSVAMLEDKVKPNSHIVIDTKDKKIIFRDAVTEQEKKIFESNGKKS